jgi:hypothetical protein
VVCSIDPPASVVGYYVISTAMERRLARPTARLRAGMPEQMPLLLIGRLAIDHAFQGISDALRRCLAASEIVGTRGVVIHAVDDQTIGFYQLHGFVHSPLGERVLLMPIEMVRALFES